MLLVAFGALWAPVLVELCACFFGIRFGEILGPICDPAGGVSCTTVPASMAVWYNRTWLISLQLAYSDVESGSVSFLCVFLGVPSPGGCDTFIYTGVARDGLNISTT